MTQPRAEYPRPQFVRPEWLNLNGEWQFEIDRSDSGLERGLRDQELPQRIVVPFAPESALSGIEDVDFLEAVWYRTTVTIPAEWDGKDAVLHFQAVDHDATVWVNGHEVVRHRGGFTPFSANLRHVARRTGDDRRPRPRHAPRPAGTRQAESAVREPQLPLHPHHRHLADRLARSGTDGAPQAPAHHPGRRRLQLPPRSTGLREQARLE